MFNKKKIKKSRKTRETGNHNKEVIDGWRKVIEKMQFFYLNRRKI